MSQGLWKDVWAGVPQNEVPITSVTNGIHTKTWMAPEFVELYDKYLPGLGGEPHGRGFLARGQDIPDEELWETHQQLKRAADRIRPRARARRSATRLGESPENIRARSRAC